MLLGIGGTSPTATQFRTVLIYGMPSFGPVFTRLVPYALEVYWSDLYAFYGNSQLSFVQAMKLIHFFASMNASTAFKLVWRRVWTPYQTASAPGPSHTSVSMDTTS